jgi:hypothetical protein
LLICIYEFRDRWEEAYLSDSPYQRSRKMMTTLDEYVKVCVGKQAS